MGMALVVGVTCKTIEGSFIFDPGLNLLKSNATMDGFFMKQSEQKYWRCPFWISSLSSCLVLEHSKCSKLPHLEHTPTADLLLEFSPVYLHAFAMHLTSEVATLASLPLVPFPFLVSSLIKPSDYTPYSFH